MNGDGVDDLLIGAEDAASGNGVAYVIFGARTIGDIDVTTMSPSQGATITGAWLGGYTGRLVAALGDVNGDGRDDIAVGSPGAESSIDVLFGRVSASPASTWRASQPGAGSESPVSARATPRRSRVAM